ncbi:MAG: calcium-binding protein, partial [Thermomicrobiales bacterium]|nr:calcium-binding protein [Thermomicrobiales bacterium]
TLPLIKDSDGDGFTDGEEVAAGTDPLDPASFPASEADAEPTLEAEAPAELTEDETLQTEEAPPPVEEEAPPVEAEIPPAQAPGGTDTDGDGIPDEVEYQLGTDPFVADTDGDGLSDGDEYHVYATGLLNPDSDGDGVLDGDEINNGTNPNDPTSY